jgi:hypothetical protein
MGKIVLTYDQPSRTNWVRKSRVHCNSELRHTQEQSTCNVTNHIIFIHVSARQIQKLLISGFVSNCRHRATNEITNYAFSNLHNVQTVKKKETIYCKDMLNVFLRQWKRKTTKVAEEYCWTITLMAGRSCGGRSVSIVSEREFQVDSRV